MEEEEDRISCLPDGISVGEISRILEEQQVPARRFCIDLQHINGEPTAGILDGWLQSRALNELQELELLTLDRGNLTGGHEPPPLPASVHRFRSTLRVASFSGCSFPHWLPHQSLTQLSLSRVSISRSSLEALLAACPVLQSLVLCCTKGCSRVRIESRSLRSIGVRRGWADVMLEQLIIKDAPCLSRLLFHGHGDEEPMNILVISAPNLEILGPLCAVRPGITFDAGATIQGSSIFRSHMRSSVKVLAFKDMNLSLDVVIEFMRCFPCLEELFISTKYSGKKNEWRHRRDLDKDLDIRLKKIVVRNYRGNQSHVDFAKFFVLNAAVLESMRLELITEEYSTIEEQPTLLHLNERASIGAQFDFVPYVPEPGSPYQHIHDLSTADPFERYPYWN